MSIEFFGVAGDGAETEISGTRYRWVATSDQGTEVVLCEGSAFPDDPYPENTIGDITTPGDGGGFVVVIPRDCRSFTAELGRDPGAGSTTWAVRLEAVDPSTGLVGTDTVAVTVTYVTP